MSRDIELYRTVDVQEKSALIAKLVRSGISYLEKWEKIPLLRRRDFNGAREFCVVYINENQKEDALEVLDAFLDGYGSRPGPEPAVKGAKENVKKRKRKEV